MAFALVEGVPFTNNQAERSLRLAKVKQKVSGSFRTDHEAEVYARFQAVISICRKQGRNVFTTLCDFFDHQPVSLHAEEDLVYPYEYESVEAFREALVKWVKSYNEDYPHSALRHLTPRESNQKHETDSKTSVA